jgi:hypothetical protein
MDAYANHIAGLDRFEIKLLKSFIYQDWIAEGRRRSCSNNEQPTRGDNGSSKRHVAGIDEKHSHVFTLRD